MKHAILFIAFAFNSVFGFSQENALEETIKKQIGYNDEDFFSFDVKRLPNNDNLAIAVAVKYNGKRINRDDYEAFLLIKKENIL